MFIRLICVLLSVICLTGSQGLSAQSHGATSNWAAVGGDIGNTRFSALKQITTTNIAKLGAVWVTKLAGSSRATPVVVDGRLFLTGAGGVYAFDASSGAELWTYRPDRGAPNNKGVATGEGMVFFGMSDTRVVALNQATGEVVWTQRVGDDPPPRGQTISAAPTYAGGLVITGVANGDYGLRGRVIAVNAKTGREVWRFTTVPGPGEIGHETWPQDSDVWKVGGGGVWMPPSVDTELGLVYFGTGNAVPQWGGEVRAGDNLFIASVVALDLQTGSYRWHFQVVRHDLWDHDMGTPIVLYDTTVNGKPRKALAAMRTDSILFLLDRLTGKPLMPVEYRPVPQNTRLKTAPTQPFPVGAKRFVPDCVEPEMVPAGFDTDCYFDPFDYDRPNVMTPLLATRAAPMSYSPETQYVYATAAVAPYWVRRSEDPFFFAAGHVPGQKNYGVIAAIDTRTNRIAWTRRSPYPLGGGGGTLATAGGLVFHPSPDGNLQALNARTGALLWQFQTGSSFGQSGGGGPAGGPVVSYQIDGKQYIAVSAGRSLWAFGLGGALPQAAAGPAPPTEVPFGGAVEATDEVVLSAPVRDFGLTGPHEFLDEHAIRPARVRIRAGARVTWSNNGKVPHTLVARDGSWTTGVIAPGEKAVVTFATPGTYTYVCKNHLWSIAQLIVEQ